jgi:glycosyltransferase involved in cell wall biosynthesis
MVFVGDGPAKAELEAMCGKKGYDAVFMGHRSGQELAECYASADIFAFPSFTEVSLSVRSLVVKERQLTSQTFGQVVLEALASGLPVIGLDAEGTRDLVQHGETGLLLPLPTSASSTSNRSRSWPLICRDNTSPVFAQCAEEYAGLLARAVCGHDERRRMGDKGNTEGIRGYTWWDAMEVGLPSSFRYYLLHSLTYIAVR